MLKDIDFRILPYNPEEITAAEIARRAHPDRFARAITGLMVAYVVSRYKNSRADINALVGYDENILLPNGKRGAYYVTIGGNILSTVSSEELAGVSIPLIRDLAIRLGYNGSNGFDPDNFVLDLRVRQPSLELQKNGKKKGIADSRIVRGYAPTPRVILAARDITDALDKGKIDADIGLEPDGKVQITDVNGVAYVDISAQHNRNKSLIGIRHSITDLAQPILKQYGWKKGIFTINGAGRFYYGGVGTDIANNITKSDLNGGALPDFGGKPGGKVVRHPEVFGAKAAEDLAIHFAEGAEACSSQITYRIGTDKGKPRRPVFVVRVYDPRNTAIHQEFDYNPEDVLPDQVIESHNLEDTRTFLNTFYANLVDELYPRFLPWEGMRIWKV